MAEYINREEVCKLCDNQKEYCGKEKCPVYKAPAHDVVEVVRCKKCKYWCHMEDGLGDCTNSRFHLEGHPDPTMQADDFCSLGERR